jgi:cation transport regulator ChaC
MPDNPQFLGPIPAQELAETINERIGPSGENREYLLHLEDALNHLSPDSGDEHVSDLARRVRALPAPAPTRGSGSTISPPGHDLKKVNSTEEQEEIEKEM